MGCRWVYVLMAYLIMLQWDTYRSAPVEYRCTNTQLRVPLNCIDWFPLYCYICYPMPYCSFMINNKQNGNNRRAPSNDVKIAIPTATKSGRTNIIIENRQLPKGISNYNCNPLVNDNNKVNIIVELKSEKGNERTHSGSSETSISSKPVTESSTTDNTNIIESESSTKTQPTSLDIDNDSDNNEVKANRIESANESTINTIIENSNIAVISYNDTATTADTVSIATEVQDSTVTEASGAIGADAGNTGLSLEGQTSTEAEPTSKDFAVNTNSVTIATDNNKDAVTDNNGIDESQNVIDDAAITESETSIYSTVEKSTGDFDAVTQKYGSDITSTIVTTGEDSGSNSEVSKTSEVVSSSEDIGIDVTVSSNSSITDTNNDNAIATGSITTYISEDISSETEASPEATTEDNAFNTNSVNILTDNDNESIASEYIINDAAITGTDTSKDGTVGEATGHYSTVEKYGDSTSHIEPMSDDSGSSEGNTTEVVSSSEDIGIDMTFSSSSSTINTDSTNPVATESITTASNEGISSKIEAHSEATNEDYAVSTNSDNIVTGNDDNLATYSNGNAESENNEDADITVSETITEGTVGEPPGNYGIVNEKYGSDTTSRTVNEGDFPSTSNGNTSEMSSSRNIGTDMVLGSSSSITDKDNDSIIVTEPITVNSAGTSDKIELTSKMTNEDEAADTKSVSIIAGSDENKNNYNDAAIIASKTSKDGTKDELTDNYSAVTGKYESSSTTRIVTMDGNSDANNGYISEILSSNKDLGIGMIDGASSLLNDTDNNSDVATDSIPTASTEVISGKSEPSFEVINGDNATNTNTVNTMTDNGTSRGNDNSGSNESDSTETTFTSGFTDLSDDIKSGFADAQAGMTDIDAIEVGSVPSKVTGNDDTNTEEHSAVVSADEVTNLSKVSEVKLTPEMITPSEDSLSGPDSDKAHQLFWSKFKSSSMNSTTDAAKENNHNDTTDKENKPNSNNIDSTTDNNDSDLTLSTTAATITDKNYEFDDKKSTAIPR